MNIKEGMEAFEDEINVNIDKTEDVNDASKHGIEKIDVEICVFVENTVSKCSVLTESSTSTQTPPSPLNAMLSSILNILIHKFLILFKFFLNTILSLNCIINIHTNIHPSLLSAMFGSIVNIPSLINIHFNFIFKCLLIILNILGITQHSQESSKCPCLAAHTLR